jgi:membrane-bound ClpP family serine protease
MNKTSNALAIVSAVLGFISIFLGLFGLVGIAAIITGTIALTKHESKFWSVAGIVLGAMNVVWVVSVLSAL